MAAVKPPHALPSEGFQVFLAGSIEMGVAEDWQDRITRLLDPEVVVLNPRRDDWDNSWQQSLGDARFVEQVEWELRAMGQADVVVYYFSPPTKAPITLLELGLHVAGGRAVVCCPEGFYRKGNVDVVCRFYGVPQVDTIEELAVAANKQRHERGASC